MYSTDVVYMYMYMYMCMYMCIRGILELALHSHWSWECLRITVYHSLSPRVSVYIHVYTCTCLYTYMYTCIACLYTYMYTCIACLYTCRCIDVPTVLSSPLITLPLPPQFFPIPLGLSPPPPSLSHPRTPSFARSSRAVS